MVEVNQTVRTMRPFDSSLLNVLAIVLYVTASMLR